MSRTELTSELLQCLRDCDCGDRIVRQCMTYEREKRTRDQHRLLERQRARLMDNLHEAQKKVDCIDFMIRKIEKEMME